MNTKPVMCILCVFRIYTFISSYRFQMIMEFIEEEKYDIIKSVYGTAWINQKDLYRFSVVDYSFVVVRSMLGVCPIIIHNKQWSYILENKSGCICKFSHTLQLKVLFVSVTFARSYWMFGLLFCIVFGPRGGGGVLRCCLDGGARLKPPNPYPSLRVILAEKDILGSLLADVLWFRIFVVLLPVLFLWHITSLPFIPITDCDFLYICPLRKSITYKYNKKSYTPFQSMFSSVYNASVHMRLVFQNSLLFF